MRNVKGITLITLVITIIILIILAGVTINLTLGDNGIFNKAQYAKDKYLNEENLEQQQLNELYAQIYGIELPENTPENPQDAGTLVAIPSDWYTETPSYVSIVDGSVVTGTKIASVYAVSAGNAQTVPVPVGFWYVGGNLSSGVVISDNKADQNKYADDEDGDIPAGVIYNEDGTVKRNLTDEEKKTVILGNQFVWIPCTIGNYTKVTTFKNGSNQDAHSATYATKDTTGAEEMQIKKYGGFYIGRYEAGTSDIKFANGYTLKTPSGTLNNSTNGNYTVGKVTSGKITTKAGEIPYYHADYETANKMSKAMYNTSTVKSGLVTGTMWDVVMKYITTNDTNYSDLASTPWGNYNSSTNAPTYAAGQGRYLTVNSSTGVETGGTFAVSDTSYHTGIRTTASSEGVKKNNIYDLAGNLFEWTNEAAYPNNTIETYVIRGGCYASSYSVIPVCYRAYNTATNDNTSIGFRPALYLM